MKTQTNVTLQEIAQRGHARLAWGPHPPLDPGPLYGAFDAVVAHATALQAQGDFAHYDAAVARFVAVTGTGLNTGGLRLTKILERMVPQVCSFMYPAGHARALRTTGQVFDPRIQLLLNELEKACATLAPPCLGLLPAGTETNILLKVILYEGGAETPFLIPPHEDSTLLTVIADTRQDVGELLAVYPSGDEIPVTPAPTDFPLIFAGTAGAAAWELPALRHAVQNFRPLSQGPRHSVIFFLLPTTEVT